MKRITNFIELISISTGRIAGFLFIPLTLVILYTITMRRFFSHTPDWGFEVSIFIFGASVMLSGAEVLRIKGHVAVDIIHSILPKKPSQIISTISFLIIIFVCTIIIIKGAEAAINSTKILERSSHQSSFNPQIWWYRWFIPLGALLIWLQTWIEIYKVWTGEKAS